MSDFNWCHGPECHKKHTVDRVRGVKGSKVLRTRKVKRYNMGDRNPFWYDYFCIIPTMIVITVSSSLRVMNRCFFTLSHWRNGYDLSCVSFPKIILAMVTAEETPLTTIVPIINFNLTSS